MKDNPGASAPHAANVLPMKSIRDYLALSIPKVGIGHFTETYLTWFSVGFVSSFVAGALDKYAGVAYAAYYTGAVNEAVGFNFWVLLTVIGLLMFALCLPIQDLALRLDSFHGFSVSDGFTQTDAEHYLFQTGYLHHVLITEVLFQGGNDLFIIFFLQL